MIFFAMTGKSNLHDQKMVEKYTVRHTITNTVIELMVSEEEAKDGILSVVVEKQEDRKSNYCFATCFRDQTGGLEKVGITWDSTDPEPLHLEIPLYDLTCMYPKILQLRLFDAEPRKVVADFKISVERGPLDKEPDDVIRTFANYLTGHGIYQATSTLRAFGCHSEADLQLLTEEDIDVFALAELTKRKLRMLAGYRCNGGPMKLPRIGDG